MKPIGQEDKQSLKDMVINEIKQYIIDEKLQAGDKLPTERKFTDMFQVSRSVVREALSYLENVGIIYVRQGRGSFVQESNISQLLNSFFFLWKINNKQLSEVLRLRIVFECHAIDEIIQTKNDRAIEQLKENLAKAAQHTSNEARQEADTAFHETLLKSTNNSLLIQMTSVISSYFNEMNHIQLDDQSYEKIIHEHEEIVTAIEDGNHTLAKELLTLHINRQA